MPQIQIWDKPPLDDIDAARRTVVAEFPFWFSSQDEMRAVLKYYCNNAAGLPMLELGKLKKFLDDSSGVHIFKPKSRENIVVISEGDAHGFGYYDAPAFLKEELEACASEADGRKQEIRRLLIESDTQLLEQHLFRMLTELEAYAFWAAEFLLLLPRIKHISELIKMARLKECEEKSLLYLSRNLIQKRNSEQIQERMAAVELLGTLKDPRALEALREAEKNDPVNEVRSAAGNACSVINARQESLRTAAKEDAVEQARRDGDAERHLKAAEAALQAGQDEEALLCFKSACETGGVRTRESLAMRRVELEKRLGIKSANELMVLCLEPLLEYYKRQGSHQVDSCKSKLINARRKLAIRSE